MENSIGSLQNICMEWLLSNLSSVTYVAQCKGNSFLKFRNPNTHLPAVIGNNLFRELDKRGYLSQLVLTLFDPCVIRLTSVKISCGTCIGFEGLQLLKEHKLKSIEISGFNGVRLNNVASFFCDPAFNSLEDLSLFNTRFFLETTTFSLDISKWDEKRWQFKRKHLPFWTPLCCRNDFVTDIVSKIPIKRMSSCHCKHINWTSSDNENNGLPKSIEKFNISGSNIPYKRLSALTHSIKELVKIDLSCCEKIESINFLIKFKNSLKSLILYETHVVYQSDIAADLLELQQLEYLDISASSAIVDGYINNLLANPKFCPMLKGIDISNHISTQYECLLHFTKYHPNIKFIGMYSIPTVIRERMNLPYCKFTSDGNHGDLVESLRRYSTKRDIFLHIIETVLENVYDFQHRDQLKPSQPIVEGILLGLYNFQRDMSIQTSGITIAFKLCKSTFPQRILDLLAKRTVEVLQVADLMEGTMHVQQEFQIFCFQMLVDQQTFRPGSYDKVAVIDSALMSLQGQYTELDKWALQLCSVLFNRISLAEASLFVEHGHFENLSRVVHSKINRNLTYCDIETIKFALSVLWSLTDESPLGCHMVLLNISLERLLFYFSHFPMGCMAQEKILGILSNIAEVPSLRKTFLQDDIFQVLVDSLHDDMVLISVLSACTISNLLLANKSDWTKVSFSRRNVEDSLKCAVLRWEHPHDEIIRYRSFATFATLLTSVNKPEVQLFALWLIKSVTSQNRDRYCEMLLRNNILRSIINIYKNPTTDVLGAFALEALNIVVDYYNYRDVELLVDRATSTDGFTCISKPI